MLDDNDDGPSSRYSYWAEVLDVGDGESTLSLAGSRRSFDGSSSISHGSSEDSRWHPGEGLLMMLSTGLVLVVAVVALLKYCKARPISVEPQTTTLCRKDASKSAVSPVEHHGRRTIVALKPDKNRRNKLVRRISEEHHPELLDERITVIARRQQHSQQIGDDTTLLPFNSEARVARFSRRDSEADAEQVAGHVIAYKEAFAKAGMVINDDTVCQIAIERVNLHEKERWHEFREFRSHVIQKHRRAEDLEHTERRHQEVLNIAKQDNDWLIKLFQIRDRSYTTLTNSFSWLILCRVCVGLLFQGRHLFREGLTGVIATLLRRFSVRCTPSTTSSWDDNSWKAYLLSPLGGAYNYVSVASASVSKSSCYAAHGFMGVLLIVCALLLPMATKHLPRMVRTIIFGICALALSDTSLEFIGAWALLYGAYVICIWHYCRQFILKHDGKAPTASAWSKFHLTLDDRTTLSNMLPPLAVIIYSCQMANANA